MASPRLQSTKALLPASLAGAGPRGPGTAYQHDARSFGYAADVTAVLRMIGTPFDANCSRVVVLDSASHRPQARRLRAAHAAINIPGAATKLPAINPTAHPAA